jgi:hypothetical protein
MSLEISNRINVSIKKTYYTFERFSIDATFALLYHEEPLSVIELSKYVRISDQLIPMDDHHYFIIYAFTSQENAYKASQNIIQKLDNHFNNHTTCIAVDAFDKSKTPLNVVNRLKQIMVETRKSSYIRVETDDILDR